MKINGVEIKDINNPTLDELIDATNNIIGISSSSNPEGWLLYHTIILILKHIKEDKNMTGNERAEVK